MSGNSSMDSESQMCKIWRSENSITIPSADILTFAFANLGQYDESRPIYVDANNSSSYMTASDARATVRCLIEGFKAHGLQEGDRVCLVSSNNIYYPVLWLAVIGSGGCVVGLNPSYKTSELLHHLKTSAPKYVITQLACLQSVQEAATACYISSTQIFVLPNSHQTVPKGYQSWQALLSFGGCDWETTSTKFDSVEDKVAAFNSTSGTTGLPKAAVIPHKYVVAQTAMLEQRFITKPYEASQLVCLPVFHAFAAQVSLVLPLRLGITTYLLPRYNVQDFLRVIDTFSITDTAVVPPVITSLLRLPKSERPLLKSLRYVLCAGAPISAALQSDFHQMLSPEAVVAQVWGATELGWMSMFNWNERDGSGSVGKLLPGVELEIINDDGSSVNEELVHGEAYVRSPSMFTHYHDNIEATTSAFDSNGFYRTGDRVYVDNGKIFIDGRIKDTMKVKGWQVSPTEIERVLLQHPTVADAAVLGIAATDEEGLEITLPRAYVVLNTPSPGSSPPDSTLNNRTTASEQDIVDFAASKLASFKKLTGGVIFIDKIPRNATGKILRRVFEDNTVAESPAFRSVGSTTTSVSDHEDSDLTAVADAAN